MIQSLSMTLFENVVNVYQSCTEVQLMVAIKAKSVQVCNMNGKWNIDPNHFFPNQCDQLQPSINQP